MSNGEIIIRPPFEHELSMLPGIEADAQRRFALTAYAELATGPVLSLEHFVRRAAEQSLLVAVRGNVVLGFVVWRWLDGQPFIEELDVVRSVERQGIGARLLDCVETILQGKAEHIRLTTFADVPWNAVYYERLGFHELESLPAGLQAQLDYEHAQGMRNRVAMQKDCR